MKTSLWFLLLFFLFHFILPFLLIDTLFHYSLLRILSFKVPMLTFMRPLTFSIQGLSGHVTLAGKQDVAPAGLPPTGHSGEQTAGRKPALKFDFVCMNFLLHFKGRVRGFYFPGVCSGGGAPVCLSTL